MSENRIKLATTDPALKDKITVKLSGPLDNIFWYIKFNIPLDEKTVTSKNMNVTDTEGYIMRTNMKYDNDKHLIVVSPLDSYMENVFYILNISKKVKSQRGQPLKREIHILFKLINGQISEYELLKSTIKTPKPIARPKNYEALMAKKYSFENIEEKISKDTLDYKDLNINIILCLVGLAMILASFYYNIVPLIAVSMVVCVAGVVHVFIQASKSNFRCAAFYNIGVMRFNMEKYEKARRNFNKAAKADPYDEDVEYALNKLKFYE